MNEQAAPVSKGTEYVILEKINAGEVGSVEAGPLFSVVGKQTAASVDAAIRKQAAVSSEWKGGTLVAVPTRSWVEKPVTVETKREVTLG